MYRITVQPSNEPLSYMDEVLLVRKLRILLPITTVEKLRAFVHGTKCLDIVSGTGPIRNALSEHGLASKCDDITPWYGY